MIVRHSERIHRARYRANMTQDELARLIKRTQQYVSAIERGYETTCSLETADRICRYLDIDLETVFAYPDELDAPEVTSTSPAATVQVRAGKPGATRPRGSARPPVRARKEGAA